MTTRPILLVALLLSSTTPDGAEPEEIPLRSGGAPGFSTRPGASMTRNIDRR
jgi:hypothetical protein